MVHGEVMGDGKEPGPDLCRFSEVTSALDRTDERRLQQILGGRPIAHGPGEEVEEAGGMTPVEGAERVVVPCLGRRGQDFVRLVARKRPPIAFVCPAHEECGSILLLRIRERTTGGCPDTNRSGHSPQLRS
jgi:hypothetical protein